MYGHNNGPGVSKGGHTRYYEVDFVDEDVVMLTIAIVCLFIPRGMYNVERVVLPGCIVKLLYDEMNDYERYLRMSRGLLNFHKQMLN